MGPCPDIAPASRKLVADGILPLATLVLPCTSALDRCGWTPRWRARHSHGSDLPEEPVQMCLDKPGPGQDSGLLRSVFGTVPRQLPSSATLTCALNAPNTAGAICGLSRQAPFVGPVQVQVTQESRVSCIPSQGCLSDGICSPGICDSTVTVRGRNRTETPARASHRVQPGKRGADAALVRADTAALSPGFLARHSR